MLQIVCGFHALPLPERGSELVFQPLEHLQATQYKRPPIAALGFDEKYLDSSENPEVLFDRTLFNFRPFPFVSNTHSTILNFVNCKVDAKLAAAEEALSLSLWTTATVCRVLSVESVSSMVQLSLAVLNHFSMLYFSFHDKQYLFSSCEARVSFSPSYDQ